jgi:hypothetical protein
MKKDSLNSDFNHFYQYQQNEQSKHLKSKQIITNQKQKQGTLRTETLLLIIAKTLLSLALNNNHSLTIEF